MSIKISNLPQKIGNAGISTGAIPISIDGVTYKAFPSQLNIFILNPNSVVVSDGTGQVVSSPISTTELNTLSGITGNVQTQLINTNVRIDNINQNFVAQTILQGITGTAPSQNAVFNALALKSNITSPSFSGIPTTPDAASGTNSSQIANTRYVDTAVSGVTNRIQNNMNYDGNGYYIPTVDAVNVQANNISKAVINTGFLSKQDTFTLYSADTETLGISGSSDGIAFSSLFTVPPFAPSQAIRFMSGRTVSLNSIGLTGTGTSVKYVGYRASDDAIIFADSTFIQSPTVCQLGLVLVKFSGGSTTFIDNTRNFINQPDIAQYSNLETLTVGVQCNVVVDHLGTDLRLKNTSGNLIGVSVNWHGANNDVKPVTGSTSGGTSFTYLHPGNALTSTPPPTATLIDPTVYWNGSALVSTGSNTSASIQRFLVTIRGNIAVQYGETAYSTYSDALNNVYTQTYTEVLPAGTFTEVGRLVVQKNNTNLSTTTSAEFVVTGGLGNGGGGSVSSTALWGSINGDITSQTDLMTLLNAKTTQSGAVNFIPKILTSTTIGQSNMIDTGTVISASTDFNINGIKVGRGGGNVVSNTVVGASALNSNVSGTQNTAVGAFALVFNTASSNTAIGSDALGSNTTGTNNAALGATALYGNVTGQQNIGIGTNAGRYIADGTTPNSGGSSNIYIGIDSKSSAQGQSNEILIGTNSTGLGSNSITLGNSAIAITALRGNVLVGTTTNYSNSKMTVNGAINHIAGTADPGDGSPAGLRVGFDTSGQYGFLQSMQTGVGYKPMWLQRGLTNTSGSVIIGGVTNSGTELFQVAGAGYFTGMVRAAGPIGTAIASNITISQANATESQISAFGPDSGTKGITKFVQYTSTGVPVESMRIQGNGNICIGTTSDTGDKLQVNGTAKFIGALGNINTGANGDAINFTVNGSNYISARGGASSELVFETGTGPTEKLRIKAGGNVLIGTITDNAVDKLQVSGSCNVTNKVKTSMIVANGTLDSFVSSTGGLYGYYTGGGVLGSYSDNSGTLSPMTLDGSSFNFRITGTSKVMITNIGNVGIGTVNPRNSAGFSNITLEGSNGGSIHFRGSGSTELGGIYGSDVSGVVVRTTNPTNHISLAINDLTKFRVTNSGNTLIDTVTDDGINKLQVNGTTKITSNAATNAKLHVKTTVNDFADDGTLLVTRQPTATGEGAELRFQFDAGNKAYATAIRSVAENYGTTDAGTLQFLTQTTNVNLAVKMQIMGNGNVLIGTTTDNTLNKLQVNGTIASSGIIITSTTGNASYVQLKAGGNNVSIFGSDAAITGGLSGDAGTYMYGSGSYFISTFNSKRLIVKDNGNILIGTTADTGYKLSVVGHIKGSGIIYGDTLTADNGIEWGISLNHNGDTDLNDLISGGVYALDSTTANVPPVSGDFSIQIERLPSTSNVTQRATNINTGRIFTRERVSSVWTAWKEIVTTLSDVTITATTFTINANNTRYICTNTGSTIATVSSGVTGNIEVLRYGTGSVSFSAGTGTTLRYSSFSAPSISEQYATVAIQKLVSAGELRIFGELTTI